jgi:hypothetical protein
MQYAKDIINLEAFPAVWENLVLNLQAPPKPDRM